jgi:glucosyl-3-phosphoglycerate synthase
MTPRSPYDLPWLTRLAQRWQDRQTFLGAELPDARELLDRKRAEGFTISVALPALNEEPTIGPICRMICEHLMERRALVDELVVIDGDSSDGTAAVAREAGANVVMIDKLLPQIPPVPGKGESLWRSLSFLKGDLIAWIDADIRNFEPHFVTRLIAPMVRAPQTSFVKAFYRRPIAHGDELLPDGGGRVTELLARPMLNALFPELAAVRQPLSGEYAGRRDLLMRLPFFSGYSVEVGLLIDLVEQVGLDAMAQVDLGERVHRNRPLDELGPMAYAIGRTILKRAEEWGRIKAAHDYPSQPLIIPAGGKELEVRHVNELERPPMSLLATSLGGSLAVAES